MKAPKEPVMPHIDAYVDAKMKEIGWPQCLAKAAKKIKDECDAFQLNYKKGGTLE